MMKWLLPVLAVIAVVWGARNCRTEPTPPVVTQAPPTATAPPAASIRSMYGIDLGALVKRLLPGGTELTIPERGVEAQLVGFIEDANRAVSPNEWFSLDRVEFETGSATLKASAQEQIGNLVAILKAFPNVALKIGGYTDNTGDSAANLRLSNQRAVSAMNALVSQGISRNRLDAEGYGDQHPVASNDTDEGRQRNRRVDVRVTKK